MMRIGHLVIKLKMTRPGDQKPICADRNPIFLGRLKSPYRPDITRGIFAKPMRCGEGRAGVVFKVSRVVQKGVSLCI